MKKADLLIIVTDDENLAARVKEITAGQGARIIFDPVAGKAVEALAAHRVARRHDPRNLSASRGSHYPLSAALGDDKGVGTSRLHAVRGGQQSESIRGRKAIRLQATRSTRIDRTFPLVQIVDAHRYMESNQQIGKIVVTV